MVRRKLPKSKLKIHVSFLMTRGSIKDLNKLAKKKKVKRSKLIRDLVISHIEHEKKILDNKN